jgi:eukaryotic-like serine/threonine-protein kinase
MALSTGTRLGPYEIIGQLGAGGMGEVYRARDTRLDRSVAIKILPAHLSSDPAAKLRFEREAKSVSALNHPNICSLFDVGSQNGTDYLVMECIEGETLFLRIARGSLPTEMVLKLGAELADALDKAHRSGVVHRDLKPGNIMLTKTGSKLLDFGLAKPTISTGAVTAVTLTNVAASSPVTERGVIVGTYQYMSPEQVEGKELDGRSDIFSLGAILYEALSGQRAFEGKSPLSVASAILEKEPRPLSTIRPLTPRSLDHIIRRCLAKDPDERWQSARDLALELKALSTLDSPSQSSATAIPGARRTHFRDFIPWIVAALAVLSALAILFLRPHSSASAPPVYSSIVAPPNTSFEIEGDMGAQPALSPDGSSLVFGAGGELWLRSLRNGTERVLSGARGALNPFWSPDSASVGFFSEGKLKTLDVTTGVVRTICAASPRGGSWTPSGFILFTPNPRDAIYQAPAAGGTPSAVTKLDTTIHSTHRWPYSLPDGKHFLYYSSNHTSPLSEQNGIYIASLDGKVNHFLVSSPAGGIYSRGQLLFVKESTLYSQTLDLVSLSLTGSAHPIVDGVVVDLGVWHATVTASDAGDLIFQKGAAMAQSRMEWLDSSGKHLSFVGDKDVYLGPRLSKDGRRLLVGMGDPTHDVWAFDTFDLDKTRLTFDGDVVAEPVWSPDASRFLVVHGLPNSISRIVIRPASGSGQSTVVKEVPYNFAVTDWSPDGRYLLTESSSGNVDVMPINPGEPSRTLVSASTTNGPASGGQYSPDGKFVAFTALLRSGAQVFIVPSSGGNGMWQVSSDGGKWARWRRDGKQLFYMSMRNEMIAVDVHENADSITLGHPTPLFTFRPSLRVYRQGMIGFDVAPDGKKFLLVVAADENSRPLTLLQNWPSLLTH